MRNSFNKQLIFQELDKIPMILNQDVILNEQFVKDLFKLIFEKTEVKQLIDDLNENLSNINETNYTYQDRFSLCSFEEFWNDIAELYLLLEELFEEKNEYKQKRSKRIFTNCHIDEEDYKQINFAFIQFILFIFDRVLNKRPYISVTLLAMTPDNGKELLSILEINDSEIKDCFEDDIEDETNIGDYFLRLIYKYIFSNEQYIYDFLLNTSNKLYFSLSLDKYFFENGIIFNLSNIQKDKIKQYINIWINNNQLNNNIPLQLMYLLDLNKDMNYKLLKTYIKQPNYDTDIFIRPRIKSIMKTFSKEEIDIIKSYVVIGELL